MPSRILTNSSFARNYAWNGPLVFELQSVFIDRDECAFIVVSKKKGRRLATGDRLMVLSVSDGVVLGNFEISEVRGQDYLARSLGDMDRLWLGFVNERRTADVPGCVAVLISSSGGIDDGP